MTVDWSEARPTIDLLKSTVMVTEVLELLGVEVNAGHKFASPFNPDERTWSAHDFGDHWFDFAHGKGGDVIDLVRAFYPDMSINDVIRRIWTKALRAGLEPGHVEAQPVRQIVDFTDEFAKADSGYVWSDWDTPLPPDVKVGKREMLIPHRDQEGIYGVKVRGRDGRKEAWPGSQFTKRLYDPAGWVGEYASWPACILTEGESDCWALDELVLHVEGAVTPVYALPSGAGSWKDAWLTDLKPFDKVWICMDNDPSGVRAREKLTSKIGYLKAEQLRVPPMYNDAREAIAAGWRPSL